MTDQPARQPRVCPTQADARDQWLAHLTDTLATYADRHPDRDLSGIGFASVAGEVGAA